jgi:hypothetical protein
MAQPGRGQWREDPDVVAAVDRFMLRVGRHIYVRRHDEAFNWSLEKFGYASGVHPNLIERIENHRSDPRVSTLVRLYFTLGWPDMLIVPTQTTPMTVGNSDQQLSA